jgi:hypothetical protein
MHSSTSDGYGAFLMLSILVIIATIGCSFLQGCASNWFGYLYFAGDTIKQIVFCHFPSCEILMGHSLAINHHP